MLGQYDLVDNRVLSYYPMYALGLLLDYKIVDKIKRNALLSILGSGVGLTVIFLLQYNSLFNSLFVCIAGLISKRPNSGQGMVLRN